MKQLKKSVAVLGLFLLIAGTLLHFLFEWCNSSPAAALIAPVNESVWEHVKLLFFPFAAGFPVLYILNGKPSGMPAAAMAAVIAGILSIPFLYYTYTGALGLQAEWFNIAIFAISVWITCTLFYIFSIDSRFRKIPDGIGFSVLILLVLMLILLTFLPPEIPLFQDPVTKAYGYRR